MIAVEHAARGTRGDAFYRCGKEVEVVVRGGIPWSGGYITNA